MRLDAAASGWRRALGAALIGLGVLAACAQSPVRAVHVAGADAAPAPAHAQHWWIPVPDKADGSGQLMFEALVFRPAGAGPFALVEINHGIPAHPHASTLRQESVTFEGAAQWFVAQGFAVVVPQRRGFGQSEGSYFDGPTSGCSSAAYQQRARDVARDEAAVLQFMRQQSFIDPTRIIVVGHSAGGFGALALADSPPAGVRGVISFAGGLGGFDDGRICGGEDALVAAVGALGSSNQLPQLWLYAANDGFFPPDLAMRMHRAYQSGSAASVDMVMLNSYGSDGHFLFPQDNGNAWAGVVSEHLKQWLPP